MKYPGIRGRVILMVVGALILSIIAATVMVRSLIYQNIIEQKMVAADILTASVVHDIKYDIAQKSYSSAADVIISKYMTYYRVIDRIRFYDSSSILLATSGDNGVGNKTTDPLINLAITTAKPSIITSQEEKEELGIRSVSPILQGSNIIGAVVLDISITDIQEALTAINHRIAVIMLVTVSLAALLLFVLLRGAVLSRLARLMKVTQEISLGNYNVKIEDKGNDEIGALARSFNYMAGELREAINKIDDHNKQLESKIKEATKDVVEALHKAEKATQAKSQFLATMSHEIRTPMNGVLGMLYLLGKTELDAKQQSLIDTATGSGKVLLSVINDVLDFSKLEAEKIELESIPFDLQNLLEQSIASLAKGAHEKSVELICSPDISMPTLIKGDPTRLRQVLTNLISNAIKFTDRGEVVLYARPVEGSRILFGVSDTGIGMSESQQRGLFKAFTQADSSTTRKYGGTGLGLAISQKLVVAMGGKISVTSELGFGSDFSFELPLKVVDGGVSLHRLSEILTSKRILVVDDNASIRKMLEKILKEWRVNHVGLAKDANNALVQLRLAVAADEAYDIAILDRRMPGIDGLELARIIRADAALTNMKLVMLSSIEQSTAAPELDAWLSKPIRQNDFFNSLLHLFGQRREEVGNHNEKDNGLEGWFGDSKLLLVEDSHVNQEVARLILGEAGFEIDICENGIEAVSAVQKHDYDIVLMDIQMPVMDGLEATRQIRALGGHFTRLPIIAMTANALSGDSDKSFAAGMNGHITKPIDPAAVYQVLASWVMPVGNLPATRPEASATPAKPLPVLPGIDVADGLHRMCDDWESYKSILIGFRNRHSETAATLEQYILNGEWNDAANLAHLLKGSGGNIGAKHLYEIASIIEESCYKENTNAAIENFDALKATLSEVISSLSVLDKTTKEVTVTDLEKIDSKEWHALLKKFVELIDADFGEAEICLKKLHQLAAGSNYSTSLSELENAVSAFDIDAAKIIAQRLLVQ